MSGRALLAALASALVAGPASPPSAPLVTVGDGRLAMGTVLEVTLLGREASAARDALEAVFELADRLDRSMTTFDPASEIGRLNRAAGRGPQRVTPEVAELVAKSLAYARLTRGSFDPTVGALVELWRESAGRGELPSRAALEAARRRVGAEGVRVAGDGAVELREGASLDLGGIAKGYALDRMLPLLRERGVEAALLDFGRSSISALGAPAGAEGWRLLVGGPGGELLGVIALRDRALSVSASLGQWVEIGGRRFGHVLDPRTGRPLTRRRQALVVAPEAALAEALSKALLVLGEEEGVALIAARSGCAGMLVDAEGGSWTTPNWSEAVSFEPGGGLKEGSRRSDPGEVATADLTCPVCSADLPLSGDERAGDEVLCTYCGVPCRLTASPQSPDCALEEDY